MKFHRLIVASTFMALAVPAAHAQDAVPDPMQQRFDQMQTTMGKAQQAATPADRQKHMTEHMSGMQEQMTAMRGMMAKGGMKPGGMMQGGMMQGGMKPQSQGGVVPQPTATPEPTAAPQLAAMQQRMDAMQQMMEQMLQAQKLMMTPPRP